MAGFTGGISSQQPDAQLLPGVQQRTNSGPGSFGSPYSYYYDGQQYSDPQSANRAAQDKANATSASVQGTKVNSGNGAITNTGGQAPASVGGLLSATGSSAGGSGGSLGSGGSGDVYVPNPDGSGPMLTQGAYEAGRSQSSSQAAEAAAQKAQIDAASTAAAAADAAKRGDMQLAAELQAKAEQTRLSYLSTIMGQVGGSSGTGTDPNIAANEEAARSAAFARAKEQAGQTALSSLTALHDVMDNSGRMGSSQEAQGEAAVVGGARGDVNDFTREQLINDLNRSSAISDRNYAGDLTRRGQNLSMIPSIMGLISSSGGVGAY